MKSFLLAGFTTLLMTIAGAASAGSDSGTITFRGMVTNDSCDMSTGKNQVVFSCYDSGRGKTTLTTADLRNLHALNRLPAEVKMHWLNAEKTRGILSLTYL
ncbi:type 1 fimbrial protein (plasmid) [Pantoea anthophila]|uniref:type 1 fimbrial protein n=1 Tax=Pantoea anthophila TaxID=470931 RepID=UPI0012B7A9E0|nr:MULTISPECIES: type 1 fimbrial protein [Pantoea]UZH01190.1 type 1 fimbrial protein [Pantoea anthophila]